MVTPTMADPSDPSLQTKKPTGRAHPLAGRSGEGPPIAPVGWRWAAGRRSTDMYFYSPTGERFRSRLQLESFLARTAGGPPLSEFCWRVSPAEFKDGSLPGTFVGFKRVRGTVQIKPKKRKKVLVPGKSKSAVAPKKAKLRVADHRDKKLVEAAEKKQEFDLLGEAAVVTTLFKKVNEETSELKKAKEVLAAQRIHLEEAMGQLRKAEMEVAMRAERVLVFGDDADRAQSKLDLLKLHGKPKTFTADEIKSQTRVFEMEVFELHKIQQKMIQLNCLRDDFFSQFSSLLEDHKKQKERVDSAKEKLEYMASLTRSL